MTTKLNIWPLLKAIRFSGRSLIFLSSVIGWIIRLLLLIADWKIHLPCSTWPKHFKQLFSNETVSLTSLYSVSFRRKGHVFIAGIGLCNHLRNTGSAHEKSISTKPTRIQAWKFYSLLHFKGSLSPFPTFRVEENYFWTPDERRPCTLRKGDWIVRIWLHAEYWLEMRQRWIFKEPNTQRSANIEGTDCAEIWNSHQEYGTRKIFEQHKNNGMWCDKTL